MPELYAPMGGAFLVEEATPDQIFSPEQLSSDARLMAKTMEEFVRKEVLPLTHRLQAREPGLMRSLLQQAGALGLSAGNAPESCGGLDLEKTTLALLTERSAVDLSFAISLGITSGVALLPLRYFGAPDQIAHYMHRLACGEIIGAFALSEANSGSDALNAQTRATLAPDGEHYLLDGSKLWVTNGGFADLFTLFAGVDGERFTAFLVERDTPGLSIEREEHKMGLHGSSTCRILLNSVRVPISNVLGEVGLGHRPALYALNDGRFNIAATALGAAKECLKQSTQYALQRFQFGRPIAQFGLIRSKLAEMALRISLLESMLYRTAGYRDACIALRSDEQPAQEVSRNSRVSRLPGAASDPEMSAQEVSRNAAEEYAVECAILKFFGTEALGFVVDEAVQIHGGYGFSEEFAIARMYRDARVFRIFEGTNEINRLIVTDQLLRRDRQGRLPLFATAAQSAAQIDAAEAADGASDDPGEWVRRIRSAILTLFDLARETLRSNLTEHQEIMAAFAEMTAALFALESAWLRCRTRQNAGLSLAIVRLYGSEARRLIERQALTVLAYLAHQNMAAEIATVRLLMNFALQDEIALHRQIAESVIQRSGEL